jgi:hypothetical protein
MASATNYLIWIYFQRYSRIGRGSDDEEVACCDGESTVTVLVAMFKSLPFSSRWPHLYGQLHTRGAAAAAVLQELQLLPLAGLLLWWRYCYRKRCFYR